MLSIVVSAVNFLRNQVLNHRLFNTNFVNKVGLNTVFLFIAPQWGGYAVVECLQVFLSCVNKSSSFWDTDLEA